MWRGEQPLARAFWLYFLVAWFGCVFVAMLLHVGFSLVGVRPIGLVVLVAAYFVYPLFAAIGVWRSAGAYPYHGFYRIAAKAVVVLVVGWIVLAWSTAARFG